jgi:hypothetical protein
VVSDQIPYVKGVGRTVRYNLKIVDPNAIPRQFLLPPDSKLYDPESYPRLRNMAKAQGSQFRVPGCEAEPESKLTR